MRRIPLIVIVSTACVLNTPPQQRLVLIDAGPADAGTDAGPADAGSDAGPLDSGVDAGPCIPESAAMTCARLGFACGMADGTDNCGVSVRVNCGGCQFGQCGSDDQCHCTPESDSDFCTTHEVGCGPATGADNCGMTRSVSDCGPCASGAQCYTHDPDGGVLPADGGAGVCCTQETDTAFCSRLNAQCGSLAANDNCGIPRSVASCGMCDPTTSVCGGAAANQCGVPTVAKVCADLQAGEAYEYSQLNECSGQCQMAQPYSYYWDWAQCDCVLRSVCTPQQLLVLDETYACITSTQVCEDPTTDTLSSAYHACGEYPDGGCQDEAERTLQGEDLPCGEFEDGGTYRFPDAAVFACLDAGTPDAG